jgi:hypothetical protein
MINRIDIHCSDKQGATRLARRPLRAAALERFEPEHYDPPACAFFSKIGLSQSSHRLLQAVLGC